MAIFAYVAGNAVFSKYLGLPYIPGAGELAVFCAAIGGAGLGFLWFNAYPAEVFMGDVGALALGAALRVESTDNANIEIIHRGKVESLSGCPAAPRSPVGQPSPNGPSFRD